MLGGVGQERRENDAPVFYLEKVSINTLGFEPRVPHLDCARDGA